MALIREDDKGVYALVGGWIARPNGATTFKKGEKTEGKHFGGSPLIGMGKLPGRGNYKELWNTDRVA